ncbi:hypothetical protein ACJIZ3_017008 [Penstemon smallii]|uniref:Uncharacterized protein n=1 Tax=Penstemon smallii TaxID=265156 RepID=A0ABD3SV32_9LAMI
MDLEDGRGVGGGGGVGDGAGGGAVVQVEEVVVVVVRRCRQTFNMKINIGSGHTKLYLNNFRHNYINLQT